MRPQRCEILQQCSTIEALNFLEVRFDHILIQVVSGVLFSFKLHVSFPARGKHSLPNFSDNGFLL